MINGEFHLTDKNQNITDENVLKIFRETIHGTVSAIYKY